MKTKTIITLLMAALGSTAAMATTTYQTDVWKWSNSGQYYYYRDNDGRVHYSDGSVSEPNTMWVDGTMAVYSANSAGPADKTGTWAIQAPKIDESKVGPAPTSPPANAVLTKPDPTKPTFGPAPTGPQYIAPTTATTGAPSIGGYVLRPQAVFGPQSGTYIDGGNGSKVYYYQRNDGANVYVSP